MHLLIVVPQQPTTSGNQVTARRFAATLSRHGWQSGIVSVAQNDQATLAEALTEQSPDIVLLLHAYHSGAAWRQLAPPPAVPLLVLLTGTDYNLDIQQPKRRLTIEQILAEATGVILQNPLLAQRLPQQLPALSGKLKILPPGIRLGGDKYPLREKLQICNNTPLFLHPAGIRPVKGNLDLLLMCDRIAEQQSNFRLAFCGPAIDEEYTASFLSSLDERPWAHYLGELPKQAMAGCMQQADVILNNSRAEGVANSLVEAASLGRPVLASDIIGNRAVIQHGKNGLLYFGQEQFVKQALQLIRDLKLRKRLSHPNPDGYSAEREGERLAKILTEALTAAGQAER